MMRCFFAFAVLLVLNGSRLAAQDDSLFHYTREYRGSIGDFAVDNLGNLYLLYNNGQVKKLRPNGDSLAVFNNIRKFGRASSIDVSNPLKVLIYYKDFGTVVILDRFLTQRATLDLRRQNLVQVKSIAQSYDNNIWLFDELEMKLKKVSDEGRIIDQSADFRLIFDSAPAPGHIADHNNLVYLYDPLMGVYLFDYYGGFKSRIPFTGWTDFNVINNSVFGRDEHTLYRYDIGSLRLQEYPLPAFMQGAKRIVIAPGNVYLLKDDAIVVYSYP